MSEIAVQVHHLSKMYRIGAPQKQYKTLREEMIGVLKRPISWLRNSPFSDRKSEILWALKDISFEIKRGEVVGVVGRNGAGKSTLLKILSRITEPTEGTARIRGRVGSLLEVGTGFHPELTGRENIYLNGAILGMTRGEIGGKFDEIVAFAEVEKFLDTPVKHYSSGMYVRLAFAVAAHLEPEILLMDEVLSVGDAAFQKKCLGKMGGVAQEGRTILFVSHNMLAIRSLCTRAVWLEQGRILMEGVAAKVVDEYMMRDLREETTSATVLEDPGLRIQVLRVELIPDVSPRGNEILLFRCRYIVREELDNVLLCVEVRNSWDISVFYSNDEYLKDTRKRKPGIHTVTLAIPTHLFSPGAYLVAFGFWEPGHGPEHFPDVRLTFWRKEAITQLSTHGISWPSVIHSPDRWKYIETESSSKKEGICEN